MLNTIYINTEYFLSWQIFTGKDPVVLSVRSGGELNNQSLKSLTSTSPPWRAFMDIFNASEIVTLDAFWEQYPKFFPFGSIM